MAGIIDLSLLYEPTELREVRHELQSKYQNLDNAELEFAEIAEQELDITKKKYDLLHKEVRGNGYEGAINTRYRNS